MLELDILPFIQALVSIPFDGGKMNEYILAAVARVDEAVTLRVIEPLHNTGLHTYLFLFDCQYRPPPSITPVGRGNILREVPRHDNAAGMSCPGMQNEETLIFLVPPAAAALDSRVALLGIQPSLLRGPADAGWFARLGYAIQHAQSMAQGRGGDVAVADLGTIFRGRHHHARWQVGQAHRRFGAVHML